MNRKVIKKNAKTNLKKHYFLFIIVCLMAAFIGSEFKSTISATKMEWLNNISELEIIGDNYKQEIKKVENSVESTKEQLAKNVQKKTEYKKILGRKKGVFAAFVNAFSNGSLMVVIISVLTNIIGSSNIATTIMLILSLLFHFLVWFMIINVYQVISRRIFLEGRTYEKIAPQRFLFLLRVKKWFQVAKVLFVVYIFKLLWSLTIIGGIIKGYSYKMVPYILAENPTLKAKDAIKLSKDMMNGFKMEAFKIDVSLLGWTILGILTFGISNIFFKNPYEVLIYSEVYEILRTKVKCQRIDNSQALCDCYLFIKANQKVLDKEYKDILEATKKKFKEIEKPTGIKWILSEVLGIATNDKEYEEAYENEQVRLVKEKTYKNILTGRSYPSRLYIVPEKEKRQRIDTVNYLRHYRLTSLILLFFIFSFIGWIWEVSIHLVKDGVFVNRGVMHGPYLPIYGWGGVLILVVLSRFRKDKIKEFFCIIFLCGFVEYFTSYYLEVLHHGQRWWDYSGYFLNLNGRICAEGLLVFALGGIAIVYVIAPLIDNYLRKLNSKLAITLCTLLLSIFVIDQVYSSKYPNTGVGISSKTSNTMYIDFQMQD